MRHGLWAGLLVCVAGCAPAATPLSGGLHGSEYHASYCMGVLGVSINGIRSALANPPMTVDAIFDRAQAEGAVDVANTEELLSWARSAAARRQSSRVGMKAKLAADQARLNRFASYIDSSGVMVDLDRPQAPPALSVAMKQGAADATQCDATKLRCAFLYSAHFNADQSALPDSDRKLANCVRQEQACPRAQPCLPPD
jgi:hypothetical protein